MEQKLSFNRCVTVNFNNESNRTLNKTSDDFLYDRSLHNVQAPSAIQPGESVTWDQKLDVAMSVQGNAAYSFSLDDGSTGSLSVSWSNPIDGSNQYSLSSEPSGLFFISYTGGGGTEATINVRFYEFAYDTPGGWWSLFSNPGGQVLETSDSGSVIAAPNSDADNPNSLEWITIDPTTGATTAASYGETSGKFKIFNRNHKAFLTASDWQNNKICLYVGNDGTD